MAAKRKSKHRVGLDAKKLAASILSEKQSDYSSLRLFFECTLLDRNSIFVGAMLEQASESLEVFARYESPARESAQFWSELTARCLGQAKSAGYKVHTVGEKTGKKGEYPLAAPLARKVPSAPEFELLHFFRALFLLSCLEKQTEFSANQLESIATQLGLATHTNDSRFALFQRLPLAKASPSLDDYLEKVREGFEGLIKQFDDHPQKPLSINGIDEKQALFIRETLSLLGSRVRKKRKPPAGREKTPPTPKPRQPKPTRIIVTTPPSEDSEDTPPPIFSGVVTTTTELATELATEEDSQSDPSEQLWQAETQIVEPDSGIEIEQEPITEEGIQATEHRSARWIFNNMQRTPISAVRWNPIERSVFLTGLRSGRETSGITFEASLCIGLMYCTGAQFDKVLAYKIGKDGDIDPEGTFTRTWEKPASAYQPTDELTHALGPIQHQISLALPGEITSLLTQVATISKPGKSLSELLTHTPKDIDSHINTLLAQWRGRGRYRLKRERLAAALATELSVLYQDPLTVFLLAGPELHQSPTIHYYQSQPKSLLLARWSGVMDALFQR